MLTEIKTEILETVTKDGNNLYRLASEIAVDRLDHPLRVLFGHQDSNVIKTKYREMSELFQKNLERFWGQYCF